MKTKVTPQDPPAQTCDCAECGARIETIDDNCFAIGVYLCPDCQKQREYILPRTVLLSELPEGEGEPFWAYIESAPRSIPPLLPGDPPGDKRAWSADYKRWQTNTDYFG